MIVDPFSLTTDQVETDVCVVGAGPAGITIAREFLNRNVQVALIESGDVDFNEKVQELADGAVHGDPIVPPVVSNLRQFGGNAHLWHMQIGENRLGVRYCALDDIDFEKRDWIPHSGWPFDRNHLLPFYERAQAVCQIGPFTYTADHWEDEQRRRMSMDESILETRVYQFGPSDAFHTSYRKDLEAAKNISLFNHSNVVEIITNEAGTEIVRARVMRLDGQQYWIAAKQFILATGGYGNAKLLLSSNNQQPNGVGNQHDVVGRYYHDHPEFLGGYITPNDSNIFNNMALYDMRRVAGTTVMGFLQLSEKVLRENQLLNCNTMLFPRPNQRAVAAVESIRSIGQGRSIKSLLRLKNLINIGKGIPPIAKAAFNSKFKKQTLLPYFCHDGWSETLDNRKLFERLEIRHMLEQSPDPENRVTLGSNRDALGCRKLEVHWRLQKSDLENFKQSLDLASHQLRASGLGDYQIDLNEAGLPNPTSPMGSHHLMGTTRMHGDPRKGVVNADCQVHGIDNLFVAGSSTFPTAGHANPTLTIIAMALRLADFVGERLTGRN
ncbi:MAG: GMC family oxidoreductase [Hyphomicrobiaceae bacterium]